MQPIQIQQALDAITAESDPTLKHLELASLVTAVFEENDIQLVVVGGSAIEFYTEGAYLSGDLDLCVAMSRQSLTALLRQELMGKLGARGGPRSWQVAGLYVDILGSFENLARTPLRRIAGPFGDIRLPPIEELIVERALIATYPHDYPPALECAKKLVAVALQGEVEIDWREVRRLAQNPAYNNWNYVSAFVHEQSKTLQVGCPYDSHA